MFLKQLKQYIPLDGKIKAIEDLLLHKVPAYDVYVYAYDGRTLVGPETLTININGRYLCSIRFTELVHT